MNPFHFTGLFRYPRKTSENLWFFLYFQEVSKENSGMKWVNPFHATGFFSIAPENIRKLEAAHEILY